VAAVDWEQAGIGPGLVDLAALTAGRWGEADRAEIAAAYAATAGSDFDVGALEACRLHLALQWLGWSPGWTPPVDHRQDWLEEAVKAAARLGLGGR
jgi:thiamine kinase-like enzyme